MRVLGVTTGYYLFKWNKQKEMALIQLVTWDK